EIYEKAGIPCEFVGHPLLDQVKISASRETLRSQFDIQPHQTAIGLLPGSRSKEVSRILPIMMETALHLRKSIPNTIFFLTQSQNVDPHIYDQIMSRYPDLRVRRFGRYLYDLAAAMDFALVTSGTATLETTLLGTPFFLLYKTSWSTYFLGKCLIRVPYLGLANLLAGKNIIPEFIQNNLNPQTIAKKAETLLSNRKLYEDMKTALFNIRRMLGDEGASARAAKSVLEFLFSNTAPKKLSAVNRKCNHAAVDVDKLPH
ncbi:MAG: hypothetical protein NC930_08790, partial [Candidatus Omnitrophica bacterium]|nr:hypothetical protein [Candidatus Omnitrophota bacterium]